MGTEKIVKCVGREDKVSPKTGKSYCKFTFDDGSSYNGMKFMKVFEGKSYRLLIVKNGQWDNIERADEIEQSAGGAAPVTAPGQFAYCPHCGKPVNVLLTVAADIPGDTFDPGDPGR